MVGNSRFLSTSPFVLDCNDSFDGFVKIKEALQNYNSNNEPFIVILKLFSNSCNISRTWKVGALFTNTSLDRKDCKSKTELDTIKLITCEEDLNHTQNLLDNSKMSWILEAYNYFLFHINLQCNSPPSVFEMYKNSQKHGSLLTAHMDSISFVLFNHIINNKSEINSENFTDEINHYDNTNHSNILNNNGVGDNNNQENDIDREIMAAENNRDWLDHFYVLSRMMIMFSIVYFYSSPVRFILVTFIGLLIYLYHNGFFRVYPVTNDNGIRNIENNHNRHHNPHIIQEPGVLMIVREFLQRSTNTNNNGRRPNIILFAWTFLSSFFISLVPEQPNIV